MLIIIQIGTLNIMKNIFYECDLFAVLFCLSTHFLFNLSNTYFYVPQMIWLFLISLSYTVKSLI